MEKVKRIFTYRYIIAALLGVALLSSLAVGTAFSKYTDEVTIGTITLNIQAVKDTTEETPKTAERSEESDVPGDEQLPQTEPENQLGDGAVTSGTESTPESEPSVSESSSITEPNAPEESPAPEKPGAPNESSESVNSTSAPAEEGASEESSLTQESIEEYSSAASLSESSDNISQPVESEPSPNPETSEKDYLSLQSEVSSIEEIEEPSS